MGKYDKILNMGRPLDSKHPPMSMHNRAAQFAPFDALTGFGGRIHEVARITEDRIDLSDEQKLVINDRLNQLEAHLAEHKNVPPEITLTHFVSDKTKDGGSYETITACVLKIDRYDEQIILEGDISVAFDDILHIDSTTFNFKV